MNDRSFSSAGDVFDLYVDWKRRLAREIPFLVQLFEAAGARRIADVACGSGRHAAALAGEGFAVTGFDPDEKLLDQARSGSGASDLPLTWVSASFADLALEGDPPFEGLVCLGNSICLAAPAEMPSALENMARLLAPGSFAVVHTINYPALARREGDPWGPVRRLADGTLLLKGFVPRGEQPWDVIFVALKPGAGGAWGRETFRFRLHPHSSAALEDAGSKVGLRLEALHGGFQGEDPADGASADLVYVFRSY
jgi:SAM-dependent methyltransferase